jgi:hypothetical protein
MKEPRLLGIFVFLLINSFTVTSQENEWTGQFNGYVKYMQTLGMSADNPVQVDNLIHNRLNFKFYNKSYSSFVVQVRNRLFYGDIVKQVPNYGEFINQYDGVLPLEFLWGDNSNYVLSTIVDRAYYDYTSDKFRLRIGRQRINWGINTTWNPNDLFNSYNIYDFDYEERQGADAIRLTLFPGLMSSIDIAYKFTGSADTDIAAIRYKFNKFAYDWQLLVGKFQNQFSFGTGWAGSISTLGFKGEMTYFTGVKGSNISASTSLDYSWSNGFYLLGTYLLNTTGSSSLIDPQLSVFEVPNAEFLMPAKHNFMVSSSYLISPVLNSSLAFVYAPGVNSLTLLPTITLSVKTNIDLDLIGQFFWQELPTAAFANLGNGVYWRFKYSF